MWGKGFAANALSRLKVDLSSPPRKSKGGYTVRATKSTPKEVRAEIIDVIRTYYPGYIFSPAHNIQAEVPRQNLLTAYETALAYAP